MLMHTAKWKKIVYFNEIENHRKLKSKKEKEGMKT